MRNDITYEIRLPSGQVVRRVIQPGGSYQHDPGDELVRAWAGDGEPGDSLLDPALNFSPQRPVTP